MKRLALLPALFCLACLAPKSARHYVLKQPGLDGSWQAAGKDHNVTLDTTGATATLHFAGRTFVIEDFASFRGYIDAESVYLLGRKFGLRIENEILRLEKNRDRVSVPLTEVPVGKTTRIRDGAFVR